MTVGLSIILSQDIQASNFVCIPIVGRSTLTLPVANPSGPDLPAQTEEQCRN